MARISIPSEHRTLEEPGANRGFLAGHGIHFEQWPLVDRCDPSASDAEILAAYAPEIEALKFKGGYATADVINVTSATPGLEGMLAKFNKEHVHTEDEVRFIVKGRGVFHIHPRQGPVFALQLDAGDWINVPAGTRHWFDLCQERQIRAIRLFKDQTGWTPHYVADGIHPAYLPICWGPDYLPRGEVRAPLATVVKA